jgi:hypothetical protein
MPAQNSRREFLKHLGAGAVLASAGGSAASVFAVEPEHCVYLREAEIVEIRAKIKQYPWAAKLYEGLKKDAREPDPARLGFSGGGCTLRSQALLYRISGDDRQVPEILAGLQSAYRLPDMSKPPRVGKIINTASIQAYDLVKDHKVIAPHREKLEKRLAQQLDFLKMEFRRVQSLGNVRMLSTASFGLLAFLLSDAEAIEAAINGPNGFKKALDRLQDRMFWPEATCYGYKYVSGSLMILAEAALRTGYADLYQYVSPSGRSIKGLFDGWVRLAFADGRVATCGDYGQGGIPVSKLETHTTHDIEDVHIFNTRSWRDGNKYEIAYRMYRDPAYAWILSQNPNRDTWDHTYFGYAALTHGVPLGETTPPDATSAVFPEYGCAMVRSEETPAYWKSNDPAFYIRTGSQQGHGHHDHFGLVLNAFKKTLYPDWFLQWDYSGNTYGPRYSRILLAHNTVMVDRVEPNGGGKPSGNGKPQSQDEEVAFQPLCRQGEMRSLVLKGMVYEGVRQQRKLGLTKEYLLDVFELRSERKHTYDYLLHGFGELRLEKVPGLTPYDGFSKDYGVGTIDPRAHSAHNVWLRPGLRGAADADWKARFQDGDGIGTDVTVLGASGTEVFVTDTPYYVSGRGWDDPPSDGVIRKIPLLIARRKANSATFVIVHQPFSRAFSELSVQSAGAKLTITGGNFVDAIDIASMSFTRSERPS